MLRLRQKKQGDDIMAKEIVDALITGGKATAAPPLGPALGPKGVNIGQVVADINKKTDRKSVV